ncbi:YiaA/YiaB family inner membrane protein [Variovorax sp. J22R133]|uniref:YiaA/YiaB family inner membrane protein n=1 Tax=Variovorax brevis TaxID=3053503 RepID=UPI00257716F5|nr:YiaA/YiaB family inner membrane protein [Variovorax sp. J22R133]MDM0115767.1 YiaA/YiaB family inner membrane protein [Variovorax sp. J22R133]
MSTSPRFVMQRDTNGWRMQVWTSFALALVASAIGVLLLPGQELDRAFLAIGFFFCLFTSFSVAKTIRDNRDGQVDTSSWLMTVWFAFGAAVCLTAWGLWRMNIGEWQKAFMAVSWLFLVSSTFTVAKTVRDKHEADLMDRSGGLPSMGRAALADED